MSSVSASHLSTVLCLMLYIKENLSFNKTTALRKHYMQTVWKIYYWRIGYCIRTFI